MSNDVAGRNPSRCPNCGEDSLRFFGPGWKDCPECPYEKRPKKSKTTKQSGLGSFQE